MALDFGKSRNGGSAQKRSLQTSSVRSENMVIQLSVDSIMENPLNEGMPCEDIDTLAESIKENGLIEPVNVYDMKSEKYMLYSGHRRLLASKVAGLKTIPALVKEYPEDPEKRFKDHTAANAQRKKDTRFYLAEIRNARAIIRDKFPGIKKRDELQKISEMIGYGMSVPQIYRYEGMKAMVPELLSLERYGLSAATLYLAKGLDSDQQKRVAANCLDVVMTMRDHDNDEYETLETEPTITRAQFKEFVYAEKGIVPQGQEVSTPIAIAESQDVDINDSDTSYDQHGSNGVQDTTVHMPEYPAIINSDPTDTQSTDQLFEDGHREPGDEPEQTFNEEPTETSNKQERQRSKIVFKEKLRELEGNFVRFLERANPDVIEEREAALSTIDHLMQTLEAYKSRYSE